MIQWIVHLRDGKSLTDEILYPHEVEKLEQQGYKAEDITSVDRIVKGKTLTLKATGLENFFVGTDEGIDIALAGANMQQKPAEVTKRFLGGYIKNQEPYIQVRLGMDPRSQAIFVEVLKVKEKTKVGINAPMWEPRKERFLTTFQREIQGQLFIIFDTRCVANVTDTEGGFECTLKDTAAKIAVIIKKGGFLVDVV
jgi:hypothetical protein